MPPPSSRTDRDIYRLAPDMDSAVLDTIAARLEARGVDEGYARLSQAYLHRLPLIGATRLLALGCGTGIEVRALRRLSGPGMSVVGLDHSASLIEQARRLTSDEGLSDNVTYEVGDAHDLPYAEGTFDIVAMHTLVSHVEDPVQVLREARRVVRPGGTVAIFDGDYASLTFGHPDQAVGKSVEEGLMQLIVANPRIMRDMPRVVLEVGLQLVEATGTVYANIGTGAFWVGAAQAYGPLLARSGLMPSEVVEEWQGFQARSAMENTFFGASNYYTYVMQRPG